MDPNKITWIYIVLLVIGGLIGFLKGKSQVSLITSVSAAAILIVTTIGLLKEQVASGLADIVMLVLLIVFTIRLTKTHKFMPSGMLMVVTLAALVFRHLRF